jgi:multicomponent Na+:H+ antiporter subunit C
VVSELPLLVGRLPYVGVFALAAIGLYVLAASRNMIKRTAGLAIVYAALALFFASIAAQGGGMAPIVQPGKPALFANPLPQAQMIGAIVVGAVTIMLALALAVRTREGYGSIEEEEIDAADDAQDRAERAG